MKAFSTPMAARSISRALAAPVVAAVIALALVPAPTWAGDPTVQFEEQDREMNAAIDRARATLPHFFDQLSDRSLPIQSFAMKVAVPTTTRPGAEHIWMVNPVPEGDGFSGTVGNEPNDVQGMHRGDTYQFTIDMVSDWNYWSAEKLHGGYTLRVMLPHLPADQAAELKAVLAPLP